MIQRKIIIISVIIVASIFIIFISNTQFRSVEKNNPDSTIHNTEKIKSNFYIKEYVLANGALPNGILVDRKGLVWIIGSDSHLYKFDPTINKVDSVYTIGNKDETDKKSSLMGWAIVEDNDGFIWFSQLGPKPLWRFDPITERFELFTSVSAIPFQMKLDEKSGDIWFTTLGDTLGVIQKFEVTDSIPIHKITEFELDTDTFPSGLFLEDGYVWISGVVGNKLIKFKILKDDKQVFGIDKVLQIPEDNKTRIYSPTDVFVLNNLVWFTEHGTSTISKYQLNEHQVRRFPTSSNLFQTTTLPFWIKQSPNGDALWINEHTGNKIALLNTTDLTLVEYEIPSRPADGSIVYPLGISVDSQNKVWFSEWNVNKIGVIDGNKSIPFDIIVNSTKVRIPRNSNGTTTVIEVTVLKEDDSPLNVNETNTIFLKTSSTMDPSLGLVNITATFTKEMIFFNETTKSESVQLLINSNFPPSGNYTLAISATNGEVTKSVFLDLIIE